jgi:hypothetical protein
MASKFNYKGVDIQVFETQNHLGPEYEVTNNGKFFYLAQSQYGNSFATDPQVALQGAQKQIDDVAHAIQ